LKENKAFRHNVETLVEQKEEHIFFISMEKKKFNQNFNFLPMVSTTPKTK